MARRDQLRDHTAERARDRDAIADEQSAESFPASDAPASWAGPPGADPVVHPGGAGVWRPGGIDPAVAPIQLPTAARPVTAWRWRPESAAALARTAELSVQQAGGRWYVPGVASTSGSDVAVPERAWLVVDGPFTLVFSEQAFSRWYEAVRGRAGPAAGDAAGLDGHAIDAAALDSGFD
jgi:hypothetical protein